jgi:hypothetical protein
LKEVPADERATQVEERLMNVMPSFIPNAQAAKAVEPCAGALNNPAIATQLLTRLNAASCDARRDSSPSKFDTQLLRVIRFVGVQLVGTLPRTPPSMAPNRFNSIYDFEQHPRVMQVRRAQECRERNACSFDHNMPLRARFAAIRRIAAGFRPPFGAGAENASTAARDQSRRSASAKRSSKAWCNLRHTPASCHSRSLRQHVTPAPQFISRGKYDHGMPVRSTKMMPRSASRFDTRGRPPRGFSTSGGSNGSTTAHNSSLTSSFRIAMEFINYARF